MPRELSWRLVTYPNGVRQIELFTDAEAEVKSRATNSPVVKVIVLTQQEFDQKVAEAAATGYMVGWDERGDW